MRHEFCDGFQASKIHLEYNCVNTFWNLRRKFLSSFVRQPCNEKTTSLEVKLRPAEEVCYHLWYKLQKIQSWIYDTRRVRKWMSYNRHAQDSKVLYAVGQSAPSSTPRPPQSTFLLLHLNNYTKLILSWEANGFSDSQKVLHIS